MSAANQEEQDNRSRQFLEAYDKLSPDRQDALFRLLMKLNNGDPKAWRLLEMRAAGQIGSADFWGRI